MKRCWAFLLLACIGRAQSGQTGPRPEWPCVAGRAVDPAYLETSESTCGQIFLFQKNEIGKAGLFLTGDFSHPATLLRAVGSVSGARDWEFAIDSTVQSLLVLASIQCRTAIRVFRPNGSEMTAANAAQSVDLQAARAIQVDAPEPGKWKLRIEGMGVLIASIRAKSALKISGVQFFEDDGATPRRQPRRGVSQQASVGITGEVGDLHYQLLKADGEPISGMASAEAASGGGRFGFTPPVERFRVSVTGTDSSGWPFQRVYPVLFRAQP